MGKFKLQSFTEPLLPWESTFLKPSEKTELNTVKKTLIELTQVQIPDITGSFHGHYDDPGKLNNVKDLIFRSEYQLRGIKRGKAKRPSKNRFLKKN